MSALDDLVQTVISYLGIKLPTRGQLDFEGSGVAVVDDPINKRTVATISVLNALDATFPTRDWSTPLLVNQTRRMLAPGGVDLVLSYATSGHVEGQTLYLEVDSGDYSGAVYVPDDARAEGITVVAGVATDYDLSKKYLIACTYIGGAHVMTFRQQQVTATAPTVTSAIVDGGTPTVIQLLCSQRMDALSVAGLSMTTGGAPTITDVAGQGTDTLLLTCSAAWDGTETRSVVVGAGHTCQSMNGPLLTTGSTAVTFTGFGAGWTVGSETHIWDGADLAAGGIVDSLGTADTTAIGSADTATTLGTLAAAAWTVVSGSTVTVSSEVMTAGAVWMVMKVPAHGTPTPMIFLQAGQVGTPTVGEIAIYEFGANYVGARAAAQAGNGTYAHAGTTALMDILHTWDGTHEDVYVNGTNVYSNTTAETTPAIGRWTLGGECSNASAYAPVGTKFGQIRAFNARLTATDATNGNAYRVAKWGT